MKVWRELQLAALQISSTETPLSKAQEDETPCVECAMSLNLDLHPLRLGRGTRSGAAPSCFRKKLGGAIALCASRGELHKHAWALRHLGQELGHMIVVLVKTCLPCWT